MGLGHKWSTCLTWLIKYRVVDAFSVEEHDTLNSEPAYQVMRVRVNSETDMNW